MSNPRISVIIPTLNEEKYLPILLHSLKQQTFRDFEVIVADAGSTDKTKEVAEGLGAKLVPGGMPGPGRNRGAEAANGDLLFFFDADVVLPNTFLEKAYAEMEEKMMDLATCEFKPDSKLQLDNILFKLANLTVRINQKFNPRAAGFCIFISRRLFRRVGGFDESVKIAEDHDLVDRATKFRPLNFLNSVNLTVSIRRLEKEGRFSLIEKYMQVEMHLLTKGSVKEDIIEYEFGKFDDEKKSQNKKILDDIEDRIIKFENQYRDLTKNLIPDVVTEAREKWQENLKSIQENFSKLLNP
ncbi:MAG TPA: glycosyltransferase [Leptospiraceae bacterium]|nr:glycosyltransferase [Leptospiraceae bacterium]HMY70068.1 glycosyltransferase [Leptospiraceae bacterium]HNF16109.1 glycosyltransferase [Leptospiraceae bacterium]HNF26789.1 glycosyltransferase [Leptospiraceae bacterium]HNI99109.1 glycosyltransferase [Leptospiraceae bacterium]